MTAMLTATTRAGRHHATVVFPRIGLTFGLCLKH
jgi:hypothetical protein